jgi:hypothetical protein
MIYSSLSPASSSGFGLAKSIKSSLSLRSCQVASSFALIASSSFTNVTNQNPLLLFVSLSKETLANATSPH